MKERYIKDNDGSIVAKFGGSSSSNVEKIKGVREIVRADSSRRFIVPSAPGRVNPSDKSEKKVTDLLVEGRISEVKEKFAGIGADLEIPEIEEWINEIEQGVSNGKTVDWICSRGEWWMAQVYAKLLSGEFIDATEVIKLTKDGQIDPKTYDAIRNRLSDQSKLYVVAGFYGEGEDGSVKVFERGGSDITGARIARDVGASVYENWTDIDGVRAADPRIVKKPKKLKEITYSEMRELSYRGAEVLQMDAVLPVLEAGIPTHLRSIFLPHKNGTYIVPERKSGKKETVVAIAGKGGFVSFQIEKTGMNQKKGIARKVLEVFEDNDVSFEHDPTGIDSMSVIVHKDQLKDKSQQISINLQEKIHPDSVYVIEGISLICLVGQQIPEKSVEVQGKMSKALKKSGVKLMGESYSVNGNNVVVAVRDEDMQVAIRAFYKAFIK